MQQPQPQFIGGFRLIRLIGEGGMGQVWLAEHPRLPRQVAVKVLRPGLASGADEQKRFLREAETAARLEHPGIVDVLDRGEDEGRLWIAMRYVDGEDLGDRLQRLGRLPESEVITIASAVASALDHAHGRGVVHRDIKPANILLPRSGQPAAVVTDFGIARALDDGQAMTGTGMVIGSMPYISPEQIDGAPSTPASDLYSFACAVYEMLTGQRAFSGPTTSAVIGSHLAVNRPSVRTSRPDLAPAVDGVLQRGLAIDPAQRWSSAGAFVTALGEALNDRSTTAATAVRSTAGAATMTAARPTSIEPMDSSPGRHKSVVPWIAAAAAIVVAASIGGWIVLGDRDSAGSAVGSSRAEAATSGAEPADSADPSTATATANPSTNTPATSTPTGERTTDTSETTSVSAAAAGDLGLSTTISTPACDGRAVVLVYNAVTNSRTSQQRQIEAALTQWPGASYLKPDPSCTSLRSTKDGKQIYAVYFDVGNLDEQSLCATLKPYSNSTAASPYAKYLDRSHPEGHFYRWNADGTQCYYVADASGTGRRAVN